MGETEPFLSILIPTWNRVDEVLRAICSVGSHGDDVEIIVVDNASSEGVYERLQEQTLSMPRVRLFRNDTNLGMVRNWNRCIAHARGEWQGLLCSDDVYVEGAIDRACLLLRRLSAPSLVIQAPEITEYELKLPHGGETVRGITLPIASGNFWHRGVTETLGGFDERFEYSADAEFWYRIAAHFPVVKVREPFARYNIHGDNYMWATWERNDFLAQTELLARTVLRYTLGEEGCRSETAELKICDDLWSTVTTILTNTALSPGKGGLFRKYLTCALRQADTFRRRRELAVMLLGLGRLRMKRNLLRLMGGG